MHGQCGQLILEGAVQPYKRWGIHGAGRLRGRLASGVVTALHRHTNTQYHTLTTISSNFLRFSSAQCWVRAGDKIYNCLFVFKMTESKKLHMLDAVISFLIEYDLSCVGVRFFVCVKKEKRNSQREEKEEVILFCIRYPVALWRWHGL